MGKGPYEPELLAIECLLYDLEITINNMLSKIRESTKTTKEYEPWNLSE